MKKHQTSAFCPMSYCMSNTAAGTSARICVNLDTASLVVSIIVVLISILVLKV